MNELKTFEQKIRDAVAFTDKTNKVSFLNLSMINKQKKIIRVVYTTEIEDRTVIRVIDFWDFTMTGWYSLEYFFEKMKKYEFVEYVKEVSNEK